MSDTLTTVKSYFETGDTPTQAEFESLIDTAAMKYDATVAYLAADDQCIVYGNAVYKVVTNTTAGDTPVSTPTKFQKLGETVLYGALAQSVGTNNFTATIGNTSILSSYQQGVIYLLKFPSLTTNSGAVNININSIGNKTVKRTNGENATIYDFKSGDYHEFVYDGTNLICLTQTSTQVEFRQRLTAAEIQTLNSAPVDITDLPAPGAGYAWELQHAFYVFTYNGVAFSAAAAMYIRASTANYQAATTAINLSSLTATTMQRFRMVDPGTASQVQLVANDKMQFYCSADSGAGDGVMVVYGVARKVKL